MKLVVVEATERDEIIESLFAKSEIGAVMQINVRVTTSRWKSSLSGSGPSENDLGQY
jgi:hypothetical protein